jgi:GNAT superfamily N-acetyltransferase
VVRRAAADEWERLRELRLRALADTPDAFGATLAESLARSDDDWRRRFAPREGSVNVVAVDEDGSFVGMASGFLDDEDPEVAYLVGMFVVPERRGRGLGRRLVGAVESWAAETGVRRLELEVNPSVPAAAHLYESCGFRPTGASRSLPDRPEITVVVMDKEVGDRPGGEPPRHGTETP